MSEWGCMRGKRSLGGREREIERKGRAYLWTLTGEGLGVLRRFDVTCEEMFVRTGANVSVFWESYHISCLCLYWVGINCPKKSNTFLNMSIILEI